jgi:hypothetical protein
MALSLFACSSDEAVAPTTPIPLRAYEVITTGGKLRGEFDFNTNGTIARLDWKRETPNVTQGSDVYSYDAGGKVTELVRSITGLLDEQIVYHFENEKIIFSEHYVNAERISFVFYDYDENGRLTHTEESNRVPDAGGYLRGTEREYLYTDDGNLSGIKEYSFTESTAQLVLESVHTFSNFTKAFNPLQPIDPLPNIVFQKNLPTTLTIEADGHIKIYTYQYTFRTDGHPTKRTDLVNNAVVETLTYEY